MSDKVKNRLAVPLVGGILIIVFIVFFNIIYPKIAFSSTYLALGNGIFSSRLATNDSQRQTGLAGVKSLDQDKALLMVFPSESKWGIWMKGMEMPIDIVWLDSNKKVVHVVMDASLENSKGEVFTPSTAAKYVVEFPAGTVKAKAIKLNNVASFDIDSAIKVE